MAIDTDDPIFLREAVKRLAGYSRFRKTGSDGKRDLLRLLRGRKIQASFDFPSEARIRINIPAEFWTDTKSGEFVGQLTSRHEKPGQFLINPAKFTDQYAARFSDD